MEYMLTPPPIILVFSGVSLLTQGISVSSSLYVFKYPSPKIGQQEGWLIFLIKEKPQPTRAGLHCLVQHDCISSVMLFLTYCGSRFLAHVFQGRHKLGTPTLGGKSRKK